MHFARPDNLYLLLLLAPMVLALIGYFWWKRRLRDKIGHSHLIQAMAARHSNRRQVARGVLVIVAVALLCVAAAQPQWGQDDRTIKRFGVDLVFALDLSNSMRAQDIPPSRLQAAKDEIETTLQTLSGDRVGLVVFTAISFAQSPLTTDYGAIRFYLDKLEAGQMPIGGTSVGQALLDSAELLTGKTLNGQIEESEEADESDDDRAKNQVIVLITDGEDHESSPLEAAERARENGIHVVTVGMGSPDGSRIPIYGEDGQLKGYKRDQKGELVYTKLDESTLERIAQETGGTYLRYTGEHSVVNGIDKYIDSLEKSELETMLRKRYKDRYMYFLSPALLLLLIAFALGERRRRPKDAPSRAGQSSAGQSSAGQSSASQSSASKSSSVLFVLLGVLLVGTTGCDDAFRDTVDSVDEGNKLVAQQKYDQALEDYREAETEVPASPELHYDLGIALLGSGDLDGARKAFARALETPNPELRFDALFNLGATLAEQEKWKEAYETYKEALRVDLDTQRPQNKERIEGARHNLEVVFRKLFPPCSELEDKLEENDEAKTPAKLDKLEQSDLALCGLDDDWYAIPVTVGTSVSIEADFSVLRDETDPEHVFLPRPQDLQLAVFDATGEQVLAVDQGSPETFSKGTKSASRTIEKFTVTPEMVAGGQGPLLMKISAADGREFAYDFTITAIPPCHALEDDFEENDTAEAARKLDKTNNKLHTCPGDDDWFAVDMELGDTLFVDLQAGEDQERERPPKLAVEIVRKDTGEVVAKGRQDGAYLTAGIQNNMEPGTLLVHVSGATDDEQGPYGLDLYKYEPCVVGDDRYEENDAAQQAAPLDPNAQAHRYLRLCDSDRDFYKLPAPKEQQGAQAGSPPPSGATGKAKDDDTEVAWGLTVIHDQSTGQPDDKTKEQEPLKLDLMSLSGDQIVAAGEAPGADQAASATKMPPFDDNQAGAEKPEEAMPGLDRVVRYDNKDKEALLLRVEGSQTFYHLTQLTPQNQNQNDKNQQNKDQNKDDQKKDDQKNKDDQKKDDQKNKDDQKKDDQKKDDQKKDEQDKQDEQKDKKDQREKNEEAQKPKPRAQDPEKRRTEDILRALEETDDNFQMKKALEDMPKRYIEKDW